MSTRVAGGVCIVVNGRHLIHGCFETLPSVAPVVDRHGDDDDDDDNRNGGYDDDDVYATATAARL